MRQDHGPRPQHGKPGHEEPGNLAHDRVRNGAQHFAGHALVGVMHAEHIPEAVVQIFFRPLDDAMCGLQVFVADALPVFFERAQVRVGCNVLEGWHEGEMDGC